MGVITTILPLLLASFVSFEAEVSAKPLFLCDDGHTLLLTDQASHGCPEYAPAAKLITVPDASTWAEVEWAVAINNPEGVQPRPEFSLTADAARADLCDEWVDFNLQTDGGLDMGDTENTRRWLALSRIISLTEVCEGYMTQQVPPELK